MKPVECFPQELQLRACRRALVGALKLLKHVPNALGQTRVDLPIQCRENVLRLAAEQNVAGIGDGKSDGPLLPFKARNDGVVRVSK